MVSTRRLVAGPEDTAESVLSDTPIDSAKAPGSAKVSRALRRLQIDGNIALGGSGSLKRKRGQEQATAIPPTPPRSHSVSSQQPSPPTESIDEVRRKSRRSKLGISEQTNHSAQDWHASQAVSRASPQLSPSHTVSETFAAKTVEQSQRISTTTSQSAYWFLPNEARSLPSDETDDDQPRAPLWPSNKHSDLASVATNDPTTTTKKIASSARRSGRSGISCDADQETEVIGKHGRSARAQAKLDRELRKLEIRANPSLSLRDREGVRSSKDRSTSHTRPATRKLRISQEQSDNNGVATAPDATNDLSTESGQTTSVGRRPEKVDKKLNREMRKLEIRANESLGGRVASPAIETAASDSITDQGTRFPRRRIQPRHPNLSRLRRSEATPLARSEHSLDSRASPLKAFPIDPPVDIVDHVLFLLAEAAGERSLVTALQSRAQDAIARDVRWETPKAHDARIQKELGILADWIPIDEETLNLLNSTPWHQEAIEKHESSRRFPPSDLDGLQGGIMYDGDESTSDDLCSLSEANTDDAGAHSTLASNIIVNSEPTDPGAEDTQDLLDDDEDEDHDIFRSPEEGFSKGSSPSVGIESGLSSHEQIHTLDLRRWKGKARAT